MTTPKDDPWLERWQPALRMAAAERGVLELGCDTGADTEWLVRNRLPVVATDLSREALAACAQRVPAARLVEHDLRTPLPFADASFGAVLASLCLHYFDWATTEATVRGIARCLVPGGLLLVRVNSTRDVLHGAGQGEEIEPHFYRQDARYAGSKRFFDGADLDRLFGNGTWIEAHRAEATIHRYAEPKVVWELALVRNEAAPAPASRCALRDSAVPR